MSTKRLFAALVAVMLLATSSVAMADTIKVGAIAPLTGAAASYGTWVRDGVELYVSELNAAGGVLGSEVELVWYDDKHDATEAINAYNQMMGEGVVALIGPVTTTPTMAVAPLAAADNLPMITASASKKEITDFGDNIFRACFIDPTQAKLMAKFAVENLSATKVAVLYDNANDYSIGLYENFVAMAEELGAEVVAVESAVSGDSDYTPQLSKIADAEPDVVLVAYYTEDVALILNQRADVGLDAMLLGADGWSGIETVISDSLDLLEGCYYADAFSAADTSESVQAFAKLYQEKKGEPAIGFNALGYDAAKILFSAIEAAGTTEAGAIITAMKATDLDCATSHISFDEDNNPIKSAFVMKFVDGVPTLATRVDP